MLTTTRPSLGLALLSLLFLFHGIDLAVPNYVDVTVSRQLNFITEYGVTFPSALISVEGTILQRNVGNGAAVGDYDNDGDLDIYLLSNLGRKNKLFRNDLDQGIFTDATSLAGLENLGLSRTAAFADLNNDGHLDLILINDDDGSGSYAPSAIYKNNGDGTFADVTATSDFEPVGYFRCGLAVADYDQDGLLDIYVTNWSMELGNGSAKFPGYNVLYRNRGDFVFEDVTIVSGLGMLQRDSFSAIFKDFDGDLFPDIFVAVDHTSDEFYWNNGGIFTRATTAVGTTHTGNDMGVAAADFDDDGDLDLYATNITDPTLQQGTTQFNVMSVNREVETGEVVFTDEAVALGIEDTYWGWGVEFTDVENDGDLDVLAGNGFDEWLGIHDPASPLIGTPTVLFINDGTGSFSRLSLPALDQPDDTRALIALDYDRDGDEDVLMTNMNQSVRLLENISDNPGHWLGMRFRQAPGANRDGIGVTIYATTGAKTRRRDLIAGDSYLSGGPREIILGLGEATKIDTLRVVWTNGTESIFPNVYLDRYVEIVQGFPDADLDGTVDGSDCNPMDGTVWANPGAAANLRLSDTGQGVTTMNWGAPTAPGGAVVLYDTLRSTTPDLAAITCIDHDSQEAASSDATSPISISYYVIRAKNSCGANEGSGSAGQRTLPICP